MGQPAQTIFDLASRGKRFAIKSRLGSGGMGEVFLAEDTVLKRPVAMKAVHDQDSQRLLREAERASQLNDEHIARIHDLVEHEGRRFLVMEYVEGETLRARLSRGTLSIAEFFSVAEQCLSGLATAHGHGIVHCDIKPENLMVTPSGVVKILDFGFARMAYNPLNTETISAAALGGTLAYLPPEVLMGALPDERSDLFALGVTFYEALAGHRPFRVNALGQAGRFFQVEPAPLPSAVPEAVRHLITRMLARDPEERYQSCEDVLLALRNLREEQPARRKSGRFTSRVRVLVILLVAISSAGVVARRANVSWPWSPPPVAASSRLLVVLPFKAASEDANARAFSAGLTETLVAKLGQIADRYPLEIVALSEVRAQKISDAQQARSILGASMVLEGSLQVSGSAVRVVYNLIDTHSRRQIHSGVVTADYANPFAVEDRVINVVLNDLDIELATADRGRMQAYGTTQPAAYEDYLRGRGFLQDYDRPENLDLAVAAFERSLKADPRFALAYAGLGQTSYYRYSKTHSPQSLEDAKSACSRAIELDSGGPDGEFCLGMLLNSTGDYENAAQHLERAIKLDGRRDDFYRELGRAYEGSKRLSDAEGLYKRAIFIRPQYWAGYKWLGRFYFDHGRYPEAIEQFQHVVALAPDSFSGYSNLGAVYTVQGNFDAAVKELERSTSIRPTAAGLSNLGAVYFYKRNYAGAARSYEAATQMAPNDYVILGNLGEAYRQLPDKQQESRASYDQALKLAEQQLKVNASDSVTLLNAALYAANLGQKIKAEQYRRSGLKLSARSNDPQARLRSAQVLAQLRRDSAAIAELEQALKSGVSASVVVNDPSWQRFNVYSRYTALMARAQHMQLQ
jgi:eukaryotic-like serine/threonine-protein kinase